MDFRKITGIAALVLFILTGCAQNFHDVMYEEVERTNRVEVTMVSGRKAIGTIYKMEPHQLTLLMKDRKLRAIPKSSIRTILRKTPVYDDYGKGISEEEITSVKTSKNAVVYGIGGGALSCGVGFLIGSTVFKNEEDAGTIVPAATAGLGGLGTYFFVRAGKKKDRKEAVLMIQEKRRMAEVSEEGGENQSPEEIRQKLLDEKKRQEGLRKERENLLRELNTKKKKKG